MSDNKLAYSYEEAADAVGVSKRTIQRAIAEGELVAHYRKGQTTPRVLRKDLEGWVAGWPTERATA